MLVDTRGGRSYTESEHRAALAAAGFVGVHAVPLDVMQTNLALTGRRVRSIRLARWSTGSRCGLTDEFSAPRWSVRRIPTHGRLTPCGSGPMDVGGATLAAAAMRAGLIDEYAIVTHPVLVGGGTPFFTTLDNWVNLNLVETRTFPDGVLLTRYETRR